MLPVLFKHQEEMFQLALPRNYYAFFVEMGLGKTRVAIDLAMRRNHKTLIIAPNTVLENWCEEIKKWTKGERKGVMLQGSKEERVWNLKLKAQFFIINYEALRLLKEELIHAGFQFIVADESTKLKGYKTQQSKAAFQIAQVIPYRLLMTGTPITNNPLDLFGQFRFLNPQIFGLSYYRFRGRYAIMGGYMGHQVQKWINMDKLKNTAFHHACAFFKKDCLDLPDKLYQTEYFDLSKEQRSKYDELKAAFITEFKGEIVNAAVVLTRLIRFSQITSGFLKVGDGDDAREELFQHNPKIEWFREFLLSSGKGAKVVIFCRFLNEIRQVQKLCQQLGISSVGIWGAVKERQRQVNLFNNNPDVKVFIGQIQTSGLGINLTAASYVVYLSNSYSYGDRAQSEDRTHRIGQTKNVTYIDLVCRGTVDEAVLKTLKLKQSMADFITGKKIASVI